MSRSQNTIEKQMKTLKEQFSEFRSTTPKYVQWLLLLAAFVIVIILLTLVLGHKSKNTGSTEKIAKVEENVSFDVDPTSIELLDVMVDNYDSESISVSVNMPVSIDSIEIDGPKDLTKTDTCDNLTDYCLINVIYRPTVSRDLSTATLTITWHLVSQPEIIQTTEIPIKYSAIAKPEPEPIVESEPVIEEDYEYEDEEDDYDYEPEPIKQQIVEDIQTIAPVSAFKEPEPVLPKVPVQKCSEFAIAGYDQSGNQIGWIKPEGGANYFHPFSDKDCTNPTGRYNIATGVITSLDDGKKIGTDAEHIGYRRVRDRNLTLPNLSKPIGNNAVAKNGSFDNAVWLGSAQSPTIGTGKIEQLMDRQTWQAKLAEQSKALLGSANTKAEAVVSSRPYDRTFILRQFKPIPATIVSEVRADPSVYGCTNKGIAQSEMCDPKKNYSIPVRATVDRNVYSDDGRTIIIPTGTLLMGYLEGDLPGPYQAFGRMNIKWYQFIRPDGVEFNFLDGQDPYSGDAQGRVGVPGRGSTDYVEQMVMPILTSIVPAAVNMIAPIADTVINQIDLDNNTIVQSGTVRSSEMAKQEVINTWNKVAQKLLVDAMDNTIPPFSIAAGTRINVYSPVDLIATCGDDAATSGNKCAFVKYGDNERRTWSKLKEKVFVNQSDPSWVGQVRSFNLQDYCTWNEKNKKWEMDNKSGWMKSGYDYRTVYAYCESQNYEAKNNAKQNALYQNQQDTFKSNYGSENRQGEQLKAYNTEVLGLTYNDDGTIQNPFAKSSSGEPDVLPAVTDDAITCNDGNPPDANGCCAGETYMLVSEPDGSEKYACCPAGDGDCFDPIL